MFDNVFHGNNSPGNGDKEPDEDEREKEYLLGPVNVLPEILQIDGVRDVEARSGSRKSTAEMEKITEEGNQLGEEEGETADTKADGK